MSGSKIEAPRGWEKVTKDCCGLQESKDNDCFVGRA